MYIIVIIYFLNLLLIWWLRNFWIVFCCLFSGEFFTCVFQRTIISVSSDSRDIHTIVQFYFFILDFSTFKIVSIMVYFFHHFLLHLKCWIYIIQCWKKQCLFINKFINNGINLSESFLSSLSKFLLKYLIRFRRYLSLLFQFRSIIKNSLGQFWIRFISTLHVFLFLF